MQNLPPLDWTTDFTDEQWQTIEAGYKSLLGDDKIEELVKFVPFMYKVRPDTLKRWRLFVLSAAHGYGLNNPYPFEVSPIILMHFSCAWRYPEGILSDLWEMRRMGGTKQQFKDMIAMSWLHGGPASMNMVAKLVEDELDAWPDDDDAPGLAWPAGWEEDRTAFVSGVDFEKVGDGNQIADEDLQKIKDWYLRVQGEVPDYVAFFAKHYPLGLKVFRARYETLNTGTLPPQAIAISHVHLSATLGNADSLRRSMRMARYFGVEKDYVIQAFALQHQYMGEISMDKALVGADELLDQWDDLPTRA